MRFGADDPDMAAAILRRHQEGMAPPDEEACAIIREMMGVTAEKPTVTAWQGYLAILKLAAVAITLLSALAFAAGIAAHAFALGWSLV